MSTLQLIPVTGLGEVRPGADLAGLLLTALAADSLHLEDGDLLVVAQKIISKAENRYRDLQTVIPSAEAEALAETTLKNPRLVELILQESTAVVRACPGVLIVRHRSGCVMANAGIDASNLRAGLPGEPVLLLPEDADASARQLRAAIAERSGQSPGVVIADSFGRPWRNGVTNVAIGAAGVPALVDRRSEEDRAGRELQVTEVAVGDLIASAAGLLMGEGSEGIPVVLLRGLSGRYRRGDRAAAELVRPLERDLFR